MSRRYEWVPWDLGAVSTVFAVPTAQVLQIAALDPDTLQVTDTQGVIETYNRYFVHRLVGQFFIEPDLEQDTPGVTVMIGPGRLETQGADTVQTMYGVSAQGGVVAGVTLLPELYNNEFWYIRHFRNLINGIPLGGQPIEHPWWTTFDIKPKRVMEKAESPVLMVENESGPTFDFRFYGRMLVTPL